MSKRFIVAWVALFVAWMIEGFVVLVQPMPAVLVAKQIVFDSIGVVLLGILVGWLYRPRSA